MTHFCQGCGVKVTMFNRGMDKDWCNDCSVKRMKEINNEYQIIRCPECGTNNKINSRRLKHGPMCGKCGNDLLLSNIMGYSYDNSPKNEDQYESGYTGFGRGFISIILIIVAIVCIIAGMAYPPFLAGAFSFIAIPFLLKSLFGKK